MSERYLNRELSWLEFNRRVLEQAADADLPPLERAKFLAIASNNLDEFIMVRVGSLKLQYARSPASTDPSGMTVSEQLAAVAACVRDLVSRQSRLWIDEVAPLLADAGLNHVYPSQMDDESRRWAEAHFHDEILPVVSPQIVSQHRPFPLLAGLSLYVCVRMKAEGEASVITPTPSNDPGGNPGEHPGGNAGEHSGGEPVDAPEEYDFAIIPLGRALPRIIRLPGGSSYVLLEELILHHIREFFPSRQAIDYATFRVTRNADVELREDDAADLMIGMEDLLESRRASRVVRLEYTRGAGDGIVSFLSEKMELRTDDLYPIDAPLDLTHLFALHGLEGFDALRDRPWSPQRHAAIDPTTTMFDEINDGDILMVHPYESFDPVVRFIEEAAADERVVAIKQALYRTSRHSPIVTALMSAARAGKYVTAIVELKARFDEARNIEWAREMEQAGVQVVYGVRGLKTHAKICIVVRREDDGMRRYVHLGTGNYNEVTARLYSDVSLLTSREDFGSDASHFFNAVTGASQPLAMDHLEMAPLTLRRRVLDLINGETERAKQGNRGEIIAKMNALVDTEVIDALYRASDAGVRIRLNIRGICCLRPGVPGLSETIEVRSIIDRYLEHARIFLFHHGGHRQIFISSADWMPRNLNRRVELLTPIVDPKCREKLERTLASYFKDNVATWYMESDGGFERRRVGVDDSAEPYRVQQQLQTAAESAAARANETRGHQFTPA